MKFFKLGERVHYIWLRRLPQQLRKVVKLTALLLIVNLQLHALSYSQRVTFKGKDVALQTVFAAIEKQTGLSFFFNYTLIKDAKPVTLDLHDVTLEEALKAALKDQGLEFYQEGKTVFIIRKKVAPESFTSSEGEELVSVRGHVTNQQGESLAAATVTVKRANKATLTDEKGSFELKGVAVGAILEVSFLGYQTKEIAVSRVASITVQLVLANNPLDEAHVIAYGQTSQRLSTGNITMVKGEDIEKQPVSNPLLALEGRVPGLYVTQTTGMPGGGVTVRIQGQNSIANGNDPLYVIDGVPYVSQLLSTGLGSQLGNSGAATAGVNGNPMNYINPSDIESVEVLKDADATAIYGSRAANGAILITTKKGKVGRTRVDINLQNGWGTVARKMSLLNTQQYLGMRHEAIANDGIATLGPLDFDVSGFWDTTRNTDWQKVLLGGTAQYTNINGSVSGGNQATQYLIGGTYHRETTVFPGNYSDVKGNLHFSLRTVSTNQRFKVQLTGSYMFDNNQLPITDPTQQALILPPDAPTIFNPDGTLNWQLLPPGSILPGFASWTNPFASLYYNPYQNKTYNLVSNGILSYQILRGLEIKANMGYTNLQANEIYQNKFLFSPPATQISQGTNARNATYAYNSVKSWIIEPQVAYKRVIGYSAVEAILGATISQNDGNGVKLGGVGYNSDALLRDIHSAATVFAISSEITQYKYNAVFGRLKYSWKDKYIMDLTARRDGSSRFGPVNQFHNFSSVGLAWIFSQEKLIKDNFHFLSFGKVRGSYGTTGSDQIGDYRYLNLYTSQSYTAPYQGVTGLTVRGLPNPYLQWEETRKLQAGVELGFWNDRLFLTANYVRNRSSNELVLANLPQLTGFSAISENLPAVVQNSAGEFMLNASIIKSKTVNWDCNINITIPKNKLISYNSPIPTSLVVVGQPLSFFRMYHSLGVNPATGVYYFSDSHGNATSSPNSITDRTKIISLSFPTFYGGVQNSFRYKQVQLDFLFQFVKHLASNYSFGTSYPGVRFRNQPTFVLNRWRKPGDLTSTQRFTSGSNYTLAWTDQTLSDAGVSDASFIRLKNVSISYQLPASLLRHIHLENVRLYLQGQNLITITKFKGLDPETGNGVLPPIKLLTLGMQVEL